MRILLARLRLLGDVAFTTPFIRAIRRHHPDAHISYLVEPLAAPVVQGNPHLNDVIIVPRATGLRRIASDLTLAARLRRRRFDIAIDLHGGPRCAWLTWASGAPMRIGYTIAGRSWMYTHVVPRAADLLPRHSVLNQCDLLAPLGIPPCTPSSEPMEMAADSAAEARVAAKLAAAGLHPSHRLVIIHVSAGNPFRRWPTESFAGVAAALVRHDPTRRVIVVSGPSEPDAATAVTDRARALAPDSATSVMTGEYDVPELRALVARAAVYIGGDSGPLHVAATTTTPIVALLGPTLPERSRPWRDDRWFTETVDAGPLPCRPCHQRSCAPGDFRCLTGIGYERVLAAAERALETT